jgi:integrase
MAKHLIPGDTALKAIKAGDPRKRISDGDGLYLLLFVKGGAHGWRFDYSHGGKRKTLSLGTYPDTTLKAARAKADEFRKLVAAGADPSSRRKATKAQQLAADEAQAREEGGLAPAGSFEAVAREWVETIHQAKVSPGHAARTLIRFEKEVFPWIGRQPIDTLTAPDLLTVLRRIEARGTYETAHRVKDACGQVFRYGVAAGVCTRDPAADLRDALKPVSTKHMATVTDPKAVGDLLRLIESYTGFPTTRAALQLAPLLFQRPGNLRMMDWAEVDLEEGVWTIPAAKMKRRVDAKQNGDDHIVPLSEQALAILRDLKPLTGDGQYVFPSVRGGDRPMSNMTLNGALQRMGINTQKDLTTHGFRAMARTMLAERLGVPEPVIEAQLAHTVKDSLGRAYNRTQFAEQRRALMQQWADYLDRLRKGAAVLPFARNA